MLKFTRIFAFAFVAILISACTEDDAPLGPDSAQDQIGLEAPRGGETSAPSILGLVDGLGENTAGDGFSILEAAVLASGEDIPALLNGPGQFTVFAPNNQAFVDFLEAEGLTAEAVLGDAELLQQILSYHVTRGQLPSTAVANKRQIRMLDGNFVDVDGVMLNGDANIVGFDNFTRNGIVHVIDAVLVPPALR